MLMTSASNDESYMIEEAIRKILDTGMHLSTRAPKNEKKGSLNNSYPKCLYPGVAPVELKCLRQY